MGLNVNDAGSAPTKFPTAEPGSYPARVVGVVDLGLQPQQAWQGVAKDPVVKFAITYEMVDLFMVDEEGQELKDKPRHITEIMPLHNINAEKAKSTARYKALDPTGATGGNFAALVGTPCHVTIVLNTQTKGKNAGKTFENVAAVTAMRKKEADACPPLVNTGYVFDLDAPDLEVYARLPKFIQAILTSNLNFAGSELQRLLEEAGTAQPAKAATPPKKAPKAAQEVGEDDIPY